MEYFRKFKGKLAQIFIVHVHPHTLISHFIEYNLLVPDQTPFGLQNCGIDSKYVRIIRF